MAERRKPKSDRVAMEEERALLEKAVKWKRKYRNETKINAELAKRSKEWKEQFLSERKKREELESTVRRVRRENAVLRRRMKELESDDFRASSHSSVPSVVPMVVQDMEDTASDSGKIKGAKGNASLKESTKSARDEGSDKSLCVDFLCVGLSSDTAEWQLTDQNEGGDLLHCSPQVLFSWRSEARAKARNRAQQWRGGNTTEVIPFQESFEDHGELDVARKASVFCFPEGVPARKIRVNASASDLNDALYGFGARTHSADQSSVSGSSVASASSPAATASAEEFIFSMKVPRSEIGYSKNERPSTPNSRFEDEFITLYGICLRTNDLVEVQDVDQSDASGIGRRRRDTSGANSNGDSDSDDNKEAPTCRATKETRKIAAPFEYLRSLRHQLERGETFKHMSNPVATKAGVDATEKKSKKSFYCIGKCYCLLSPHPLFPVHFDVLRTILRQERLHRISIAARTTTASDDRDQESSALAVAEAMGRNLSVRNASKLYVTKQTRAIVNRFAEQRVPDEGEYMCFSLSEDLPMITYKRPITVRVSIPASPKAFKGEKFASPLLALKSSSSTSSSLPSSSSSVPLSPIYKRFLPSESHDEDAEVSAESYAWLVASWACPTLMSVLSFDRLLFTLALVLLEQKVVFVAESLHYASAAAFALREMLRPLKWPSAFVPIIPSELKDFVKDSPVPVIAGISSAGLSQGLAKALMDAAAIEESIEQSRSFVSLTRVECDCAVVLLEGGGRSGGRVVVPPSLWRLMVGRLPSAKENRTGSPPHSDGFATTHLKFPKIDKLYHDLCSAADGLLFCVEDRAGGGGELLTGEEERTEACRKILWTLRRHILGIIAEAARAKAAYIEEEKEVDKTSAIKEGRHKKTNAVASRLKRLRLTKDDESLHECEERFVARFARSQMYANFTERWFAGSA